MPLHNAGSALALADTGYINDVPGCEDFSGELLAEGVLARVARADLDEMLPWRDTGFLEVSGTGLGQLLGLDSAETELDGRVPIVIRRADLGHHARPSLDNSHGDNAVVLIPELGHAELGAQHALHCAFCLSGGHR